MNRLEMRLPEKSDWVKVFDPRDSTVFVASNDPLSIGEQVRIDLTLGKATRVILRGQIIARRTKGDNNLPTGFSVALGAFEREKVNYLNGYVRGGMLDLRTTRRLPIRIPVSYGGVSGTCEAFTRDLNEQGIFVVTETPLPEGSKLHILLKMPWAAEPVSVSGTVSHTVVVEDEDVPGMGVQLELAGDEHEGFVTICDRLEQLLIEGKLADEYLL